MRTPLEESDTNRSLERFGEEEEEEEEGERERERVGGRPSVWFGRRLLGARERATGGKEREPFSRAQRRKQNSRSTYEYSLEVVVVFVYYVL
jgi:hypothetical protein